MKKIFFPFSLSILLWACSNDAANTEATDTTATEATALDEGEAWLSDAFPQFYAQLAAQDASFRPGFFAETEGGTSTPPPARFFAPEELEPFRPYLVYNSDSSKALDLLSYNYLLVKKNGQTAFEAAGPDTEVAVINMKDNMRTRIFFSGPGTVIRHGKWLDDNTVLLGGAEVIDSTKIQPVLLRIDINANSRQRFTYTDTLQASIE